MPVSEATRHSSVPVRILDVSGLPHAAMDHRSQIWWGNLIMVIIESVMFAILVGVYSYTRLHYDVWPPPQVLRDPVVRNGYPHLLFAMINLVVLTGSAVPMYIADRACLRMDRKRVDYGLIAVIALGFVAMALRAFEFRDLLFRWDENAYASTAWTILGLHLMHIIIGTLENCVMLTWVVLKGLDEKHARDIRVAAVYWYWTVGTWVLLHILVFWGPRFL